VLPEIYLIRNIPVTNGKELVRPLGKYVHSVNGPLK
jgi:hypothetical protein